MLKVEVRKDEIRFGGAVSISFHRTLRIPDDGKSYPLPPGLGEFPILRVDDYLDRVPASWRDHGGALIPMYQREALWISFAARWWKPCAVKIGIGRINAVTGDSWTDTLSDKPQDYLVVPDQPWLDGINAGQGHIRQFVAVPLGEGYTAEGQLTDKQEHAGIQLVVFEPQPGRFPDRPPPRARLTTEGDEISRLPAPPVEIGLGAAGRMAHRIYPDEYGIDTWDQHNFGRVYVHLVNSLTYCQITGTEPPPTPISAREYTRYGLPWFDLYDESHGNLNPRPVVNLKPGRGLIMREGQWKARRRRGGTIPG